MLGFKNTFVIERKDEETLGNMKQEVRVIDGSIFLVHWHVDEEYWSYDQLSRKLLNVFDFSNPKKALLEDIFDNLDDIIMTINTLRVEEGFIKSMECGKFIIKVKQGGK